MGVLMSKEFKKATAGAFDRDVKAEPEHSSGRVAKRRKTSGPEPTITALSNAKEAIHKSTTVKPRRVQPEKLQGNGKKDDEKKGEDIAWGVVKVPTSGKGATATAQAKSHKSRSEEVKQHEQTGNEQKGGKDEEGENFGSTPASTVARAATRSSKRKRESTAPTLAPTSSLDITAASPSQSAKDQKATSTEKKTLHPPYTYSKTAIPGITHLYTSKEEPSQYRHIRSEYTLPILKLAPNTPPPPPPSERVSSSYFAPEPVVLIQNSIAHSLYALLVQAILWNQTTGKQARPVLDELLRRYPDPKTLAGVEQEELAELLQPIGLFNSRAKRLRDLASTWVEKPPLPGRGYTRTRDRKYTDVPIVVSLPSDDAADDDDDDDEGGDEDAEGEEVDDEEEGEEDAEGEEIDSDDSDFQHNIHNNSSAHPPSQNIHKANPKTTATTIVDVNPDPSPDHFLHTAHSQSAPDFWEIAHLPGVGPYALDSFRIFHRDEMRGLASDHLGAGALDPAFEPEWRRVLPLDKDLRLYVRYLWMREGWVWDPLTGRKVTVEVEERESEAKGKRERGRGKGRGGEKERGS